MPKVAVYSLLLIAGLAFSQLAPSAIGTHFAAFEVLLRGLTMTALAFIMIQVGVDFEIDKTRLKECGFDYLVAMTAAALPWILCAFYFVFVMAKPSLRSNASYWEHILLLSRFAAPTSAGVLFSMLAAANLNGTWLFRKARVLAIFDDVDTILMVPVIQMVMVGLEWQLVAVGCSTALMVWLAWHYLHAIRLPRTWTWVLLYAVLLTVACEALALLARRFNPALPVRIEVLLPSFALGCALTRSARGKVGAELSSHGLEAIAANTIGACFIFLVGASMPLVSLDPVAGSLQAAGGKSLAMPAISLLAAHVLAITALSNLGKLFPAACYRREAAWRARLALGIAMFPRGEVGAGVLAISLAYGVSGSVLTVATLSLTLNLVCTGFFIAIVKRLLHGVPTDALPTRRRNMPIIRGG